MLPRPQCMHGRRSEGHVIFLDREGARHGAREISNKPAVLHLLRELFGERLRVLRSHEHSLSAASALFSGASMLIGSHGAAFQNAIWLSSTPWACFHLGMRCTGPSRRTSR